MTNALDPELVAHLGAPDPEAVEALHPASLQLDESLKANVRNLHRLPHMAVGYKDFQYPEGERRSERVIEHGSFPINRIVGVASFESWAGRGLDKHGEPIKNGAHTSAEAIHFYANKGTDADYLPRVAVFKDNTGEVWGAVTLDGSHRAAGAKLKGDENLGCSLEVADYDELPVLDADVSAEILAQAKERRTLFGRFMVRAASNLLAQPSKPTEKSKTLVYDDSGFGRV